MRDSNLELKIKYLKEFMQLWIKFHDMYKSALKSDAITPDEEKSFLETKSLIARRYQMLKENLGISPSYEDRTFDVISQLLSLKSVSAISDLSLHKVENDWHSSYIVLNKFLGELEARQESLRRVSRLGIILRDLAGSPIINLALLIIVILAIYMAFVYIGKTPRAVKPKVSIEFKQDVSGAAIDNISTVER